MKKSGLSTAILMALVGGGLAGCSHNCYDRGQGCGVTGSAFTTGKVVDGPIAGATIYFANADGTCGTTVAGLTDSNGNFSAAGSAPNGFCAVGGQETAPPHASLVGVLKAPAGGAVATPLTTLFVAAQAAAAAKTPPQTLTPEAFATSMGLSGVDLLNADPSDPANAKLEQVGAAVQSLMASIAQGLAGNGVDPTAIFADVVSAVSAKVAAGTLNLAQVASSGDFGSVATSIATAAQAAVANDPAISPSQKEATANVSASSVGSSAAQDANSTAASNTPTDNFAELASVTANGSINGVLNTANTGAADASLIIPASTAFTGVSISLGTLTGTPINQATGTSTVIRIAPVAVSGIANSQYVEISIPTDWTQSATSGLVPTVTSGAQVQFNANTTKGDAPASFGLDGSKLLADHALSTAASGTISINITQLLADMGAQGGSVTILSDYNGTTTAGKNYTITTTVPGVLLKTYETSTSPVVGHKFTTSVHFNAQ